MEGYAAKTPRLDDVEETLPSFDPMVDAAEKQNIAMAGTAVETPNALEVSGYWFNPGKDTVEMHFISQGGSEIRSVHFGKVKEGEGSNRGSGYQLWVSLDSEPVCALAVGFHHSNITTSTLSPHWLVSEGCGVWRSPDHCVAFVLQNVFQNENLSQRLTWDVMRYGSIAEFNHSSGIEFDPEKSKILLKWFAPGRKVAYVLLRTDESIQFGTPGVRTPGEANGVWSYYKEADGSEYLITWFHYGGKRNADGIPQAEATVLQKMNFETSLLNEVTIWRAVGTLSQGVENFMVQKYEGSDAKSMRQWHVFVQIVWQA